jgi:hypothetical protein
MSKPKESPEKAQLRNLLSEAGLLDIPADELPKRIKQAKDSIMHRLVQLIGRRDKLEERESAAYMLGTLKKVEMLLAERRVNRKTLLKQGPVRAKQIRKC